MFQPFESVASASTTSGDGFSSPSPPSRQNEPVRHLLYGSPKAVQIAVKTLH